MARTSFSTISAKKLSSLPVLAGKPAL